MHIALPTHCPVPHLDDSSGRLVCELYDESREQYDKWLIYGKSWCFWFCNPIPWDGTPCYLGCPLFSRWYWEKAAHHARQKAIKGHRRVNRDWVQKFREKVEKEGRDD